MKFNARLIEQPTLAAIGATRPDYETMLVTVLDAILSRYAERPDYPFIDTKLSTITGEDFPDDSFKGRGTIFTWIQGRGMEAMADHARWLPACGQLSAEEIASRQNDIRKLVADVMKTMEAARARSGGHASFMINPEGQALSVDDDGVARPTAVRTDACNVSDVFYSKGLFAAANRLGHTEKAAEAKAYFRRVTDDIAADRLYSDQQSFDPKNRVTPIPGRHTHGPRMLAIGGCGLFFRETAEDDWLRIAEQFIGHIVRTHINQGQIAGLQDFDFVEAVNDGGRPWSDERGILSDPGHALEFVGFATKALLQMQNAPGADGQRGKLIERCRDLFPRVLVKNFENGFNHKAGGICKAFDLKSRTPINGDLPWWSLPETIRAAMLIHCFAHDEEAKKDALRVLAESSNAFMARFVNPGAHLMAYQTRNAEGDPVDVIPATPDADPGYHTGLSLIDFLNALGEA